MMMIQKKKESYKMILQAFTILSSIGIVFAVKRPCDKTYTAGNGHLCYPCSPGNYKVSDCVVDLEQSRCRPCLQGTFMPYCDNATRCELCKWFCPDRRQVIVKNCTAISDLECQCRPGFFWSPNQHVPSHGQCIAHQMCTVGEGLAALGTPFADTKCTPCLKGLTYSNRSSLEACIPCTSCDTSVKKTCTVASDTVCGHENHKQRNENKSGGWPDTGGIFGLVVALIALAVLFALIYFLWKLRLNKQKEKFNKHKNGSYDSSEAKVSESRAPDIAPVHSSLSTHDEMTKSPALRLNETHEYGVNDVVQHSDLSMDVAAVSDLSMDVAAVSARSEMNHISIKTQHGIFPSQDLERGESAGTEPSCPSCNQYSCKTSDIVVQESSIDDKIWFEVRDYLQQMGFDEFKMFVRRLAYNTNATFYETIDDRIDNSREENAMVNERIYQILTKWRRATPMSKLEDVFDALRSCNLNKHCHNLIQTLKDKLLLKDDYDELM